VVTLHLCRETKGEDKHVSFTGPVDCMLTLIHVVYLMTAPLSVGYFSAKLSDTFLVCRSGILLYHNVTMFFILSYIHAQKYLDM
jgi:hypothetical protein